MEEQELPVGWTTIQLNDAGGWGSGGTPSRTNARYYENGTIPWLVIGDLKDDAVKEFSTSITEEGLANSSAKLIPSGSLLVAMYGSIGKLGITTFPCTTNQAIAFCIPNDELVSLRYIFHALANAKPELIAKGQGGAQQNISQGILKEHRIPLAPLNEQRRIAAKLDTTLAAVDACRQRLDGVAAILKRFRQAVLAAATSGELTREWRGERGIGKQWTRCALAEIAEIQGGITKDSKKQLDDYPELPYLRVANVQRGYLDLAEVSHIRVPPSRLDLLLLESGDILFNEGGDRDKVGRGWIWEGQIRDCVFQNHIFRARLIDSENEPKFVSWWSNTRGAGHFLGFGKQTTNLASISKTTLGSLPIDLPPAAEQREIVRRVEDLFLIADQLEAKLTAASKIVDRLTPALLAKAFCGELVPQDPNDEPASVLLARVRAAHQEAAASAKPPRPRRRNAHASLTKPPPFTNMLTRNDVTSNHLNAILKECGPLSAEALWSASQLEIDDFYDQLRDEEAQGLLRENRGDLPNSPRLLEPAA